MASSVIHMAVAHEINKIIKRNYDQLLIGSIAPDISKQVGQSKNKSHFLDNDDTDIPNIESFLDKYRNKMDDDFVMGYFIHLYTDYLWFKYFIPEFCDDNMITKLDGTTVKCTGNMLFLYIYSDYTNLNLQLFDEYDMDLHIFYEEHPPIENIIEEIPMDEIQIIIDKASVVIENSSLYKDFVFNINNIRKFIDFSVELIIAKLNELDFIDMD